MNKNYLNKYFEQRNSMVVLIVCATLLITFLFSSCNEQKKETIANENKKDVYYTCSMHPQVHEDKPGDCPICGMKLIAVPKNSTSTTTEIHLSPEQIALGNIQADTVSKGSIGDKLILTGTLNFNQDKLSSVSARVEGRIEKLYFKNMGDYVDKGDKLYDLYSEQLNNAKQEYINALQQQNSIGNSLINYGSLVESAKNKLLLLGMTNEQVKHLGESKQSTSLTSFYSTETGYITMLNVNEGDYVMEGGSVVQLANLSTLWAVAQVYTTEISSLSESENVSVQIPDLNNQIIKGTIDFINPEINPDTRINLVRVTIQNKNNQLHPGMPVYIIAGKKQHNSITLPADAILTDSKGSTVWIQIKPGVYEIRMVKTGITENDAVEITSGLNMGDVVVTNGTYLLNSEYIFEHGSDPMAGMKM
jgi:membrane fusion protein, copper/silver efflux system